MKGPPTGGVSEFVQRARAVREISEAKTRLIFALDATASREPTWELAKSLHESLFEAAVETSAMSLQLCYFRGLSTFFASPWLDDPTRLREALNTVYCEGGTTQIGRLITHCLTQYEGSRSVKAIIFVGDACEENADALNALAVRCRLVKRPLLLFQEGHDAFTSACFSSMAALSGGAHLTLDGASDHRLHELLQSAVRFATGGAKVLQGSGRESDRLLLEKLSRAR